MDSVSCKIVTNTIKIQDGTTLNSEREKSVYITSDFTIISNDLIWLYESDFPIFEYTIFAKKWIEFGGSKIFNSMSFELPILTFLEKETFTILSSPWSNYENELAIKTNSLKNIISNHLFQVEKIFKNWHVDQLY
jgi:hypothetical protein